MGFDFTTLVVISTDCTGSCKSNYHMSMTTTAALGSRGKKVLNRLQWGNLKSTSEEPSIESQLYLSVSITVI